MHVAAQIELVDDIVDGAVDSAKYLIGKKGPYSADLSNRIDKEVERLKDCANYRLDYVADCVNEHTKEVIDLVFEVSSAFVCEGIVLRDFYLYDRSGTPLPGYPKPTRNTRIALLDKNDYSIGSAKYIHIKVLDGQYSGLEGYTFRPYTPGQVDVIDWTDLGRCL